MRNLPRSLLLLSMIMALIASDARTARSEELPLFISSFAAGEEGGIQAATLDLTTGLLKLGHRTTGVENPFFLALSPDRKFLYSIHAKNFGGKDPEQVAAYAVVGNAGELKLLNRQSTHGTASCYLEVDASGKSLLVANYATGNVAALPIQADGSLGEAASVIRHVGRSIDPDRQKGAFAHCIVRSPDNRFALAADLGIDKVLIYALDSETAQLTPHRQPFVRTVPGSGPRHLTFHPNGKHVYVINELSNSVTMFDYLAEQGFLIEQETRPTVPMMSKDEKSYCADLKITPNGKYLYGTNRGHDSIACFSLSNDGHMSRIEIVPSLGKGPQNLAITPGGEFLVCANMPGDNVAVFRIDPATGKLTKVGEPVTVKGPSCIMQVTGK